MHNTTQIQELVYPVYRLSNPPIVEDSLMFYYSEKEEGTGKLRILDDKNVEGNTLAMRRLNLVASGVAVSYLDTAIFFLGDLIKIAKAGSCFIDSRGKLFIYKKQTRAKLKFHRIEQILKISSGGAVVVVQGLSQRFKVLYAPESNKRYAGILYLGLGTILYGLYEDELETTWRMV